VQQQLMEVMEGVQQQLMQLMEVRGTFCRRFRGWWLQRRQKHQERENDPEQKRNRRQEQQQQMPKKRQRRVRDLSLREFAVREVPHHPNPGLTHQPLTAAA
jgi:hypothetical protein